MMWLFVCMWCVENGTSFGVIMGRFITIECGLQSENAKAYGHSLIYYWSNLLCVIGFFTEPV